ncbi:MAG: PAS domain S-box protein [Motilibacteraceae bacterium]
MDESRARGGPALDVLRRRVLEQEALLALARCALEDPDRVLLRACELTAAVLRVPWVEVLRLAPDGTVHRLALSRHDLTGTDLPAGGAGAEAARSGQPRRLDDVDAGGVRSSAGVPIRHGDRVWGALAAHDESPGAFSAADERFLEEAAGVLSAVARAGDLEAERERRQLERRALDAAGDGLALLDRSGRLTYANLSFAALLGTTPDDLLGADLHEVAHHTRPDGSAFPREECPIARACATGEPLDTQRQLMFRADGSTVQLSATVRPVPSDGGPAGVVLSLRDVGAVVQAEQSLAESERRHRAVVDSLTEGVLVQDADGLLVSANPAALRLLQLAEHQLVGSSPDHPLREAVDESGVPLAPAELPTAVALRTGRPVRGQVLGMRVGDDVIWLRVNAEPLDEPGRPTPAGVVASFSDITSERRTMALLADSERRYRLMAESSSDVISTSRGDGTYTYVSPAVRRILGWEPEDLLGRRPRDFLHPDDVRSSMARRADVLERRVDTGTVEARFRLPDGTYRWVEITGHLAQDVHGDPELHAALRVIEDRRAAEAALRASEQRFRQAMEHAPLGTALLDLEGRLTDVNRSLCDLLERGRRELLHRPLADFLHPADVDADRELVRQLLAGEVADVRDEQRYLRPDGRTLWARVTRSVLRDRAGAPAQVVAQLEDVTADRQARQSLTAQALHDPLTGLANRVLAEDRLRTALARSARRGPPVTVLFCDLDGFKAVNDALGHGVGDDVLREVADRLANTVRDRDTVARVGGDEFLVVAEDLDPGGTEHLVARLRAAVAEPIPLAPAERSVAGRESPPPVRLGLSIGVATTVSEPGPPAADHSHPSHRTEAADLVRRADAAMYADKLRRRAADGGGATPRSS